MIGWDDSFGTFSDGSGGSGAPMHSPFSIRSITDWKVLGREGNRVIITTADPIPDDWGYGLYLGQMAGYANSENELNKICALYGQGKYADTRKYSVNIGSTIHSGGRSINLNDLENIGYTVSTGSIEVKRSSNGNIYENDGTTESEYSSFLYWDELSRRYKYMEIFESGGKCNFNNEIFRW